MTNAQLQLTKINKTLAAILGIIGLIAFCVIMEMLNSQKPNKEHYALSFVEDELMNIDDYLMDIDNRLESLELVVFDKKQQDEDKDES